jgi:Novel STAND NTPase 1
MAGVLGVAKRRGAVVEAAAFKSLVSVEKPKQPYPGLRPFEPDEWTIFFGRESMIDDVIQRLADNRVVLIHGASGSGKSSLVRAGVFPKLARQHLRRGVKWLTCAMRPSGGPLWNLAREFARFEGRQDDLGRIGEIIRLFNRRGATLASVVATIEACAGKRLCILVDQFEELFRFERETSREEAELFVSLLIDQVAGEDADGEDSGKEKASAENIHVAVTMRSEFLGDCARFDGFAEAVNRTQYLVPRIGYKNLMRAIRRPAELFDGEVSVELAERMIADVRGREDELPLIQHGLMLLWNNAARAAPGQPIRLGTEQFEQAGGLAKLLSDHADDVMDDAKLTPRLIAATEKLFRALTDINAEGKAIRRPLPFNHLAITCGIAPDGLRGIIDSFRADGVSFLTPFFPAPVEDKTVVDISHEALIRCWSRISDPLNGWLRQEFQDGLVWRSLSIDAKAFVEDKRYVLAPAAADQRARWLENVNRAWSERYGGEWDNVAGLLQASQRAANRSKIIRRLLLVLPLLLVAIGTWSVVVPILGLTDNTANSIIGFVGVVFLAAFITFATQLVVGLLDQYIRSWIRFLPIPGLFIACGCAAFAGSLLKIESAKFGWLIVLAGSAAWAFIVWAILMTRRLAVAFLLPRLRQLSWFQRRFPRWTAALAALDARTLR